jgi:DNA-binding SARP family transcriptional activator
MDTPVLYIRLLGELELRYGASLLPPLESARAASLLTYLLVRRSTPQARQRLAFLLWPDSTESQAQTNLRHVLHTLRQYLPEPDRFILATSRTLQWRADAPFWLDIAAFEDALAQAERSVEDGVVTTLRSAIDLYHGDLLEGWYDEWLLAERDNVRQRYLEALYRLTAELEARGDLGEATSYAERLLRSDPLREETYRQLIHLHAARGDRARALRVYHACMTTLEQELGAEPSAQTREIYETLLRLPGEVEAPKKVESRVGGPPFVGRAAEKQRLASLWRASEHDGAHLLLVKGEAGVGKTRLIDEFRAWCVHKGAMSIEARAYPAEGTLAYGPVVTWLRAEPVRARLQRVGRAHLTELARLLPELLGEGGVVPPLDSQQEAEQRQRLFDAVATALQAAGGPLVLVADDLQWWDRESLQFLHYLLRIKPEAHLLVAATARLEEIDQRHPVNDLRSGLDALGRLTEIDLERLSLEETAILAEQVLGYPLDDVDVDRLHYETKGNILFVVEALRAGWSNANVGQRWSSPKVQAVIESRLRQLSEPAQVLVGIAATIGREFTSDELAHASDATEETLVQSLDELWLRRIISDQGADAYDFSHDKIREAAYQALSPVRRRRHHIRVAQALERAHAQDAGQVSGQIAGHYERGGAADQAIVWYVRAAEAAQHVYANREAIHLLEQALELVHALPPTSQRDTRELEILTHLAGLIGVVEGFASSRLSEAQRRALELSEALGADAAPPLLRSLAIVYLCRDDFKAARRVGQQLRTLGERDRDDVLCVESDYTLGIAAFWSGELTAAQKHFEAAVKRYRAEQRNLHLTRYGQDTKVICLSRLANTLWLLGRTDSAVRASTDALAMAEDIGHPFSRATALAFATLLALDMRDVERLRNYTSALEAARSEHVAQQILVAIEMFGGVVDVLDGQTEHGINRLQWALENSRDRQHSPGQRAMTVHALLEAWVAAGDMKAGLAVADKGREMSGATHLWDAEIHRLRAEFLAALSAPAQDVEHELGRALEISRRQGARMLQLRAAASLLRYRLERGDSEAVAGARASLGAIIESLPEKGDTQDLREATSALSARN